MRSLLTASTVLFSGKHTQQAGEWQKQTFYDPLIAFTDGDDPTDFWCWSSNPLERLTVATHKTLRLLDARHFRTTQTPGQSLF